jgi:molecular chaperone DnaK (HSP70)/membrane protein implicated in regulation of membrane protease activity
MTVTVVDHGGPRLVFGFDLGHGETSLATLREDSNNDPLNVDLPSPMTGRVMPTAVAEYLAFDTREPSIMVGAGCFGIEGERLKEIYLTFKNPTLGREPRDRRAVELFVDKVVRHVMASSSAPGEDGGASEIPPGARIRWVFGVPSGWDAAACKEYEELLAGVVTTLFPHHEVEVVPESRAALLYGQRSGDLGEGERDFMRSFVRSSSGRRTALIIDMGSSTTDFTFVSDLHETPVDSGSTRLGAALIEQQLMWRVVAAHRDSVRLNTALQNKSQLGRLEFACRLAKEKFFRLTPEELRDNPGERWLGGEDIYVPGSKEKIEVVIRGSAALMDEILDTPLDVLGGRSWREALHSELTGVLEAVRRRSKDNRPPDVVLLTGGASRMRFAQDLCRDVFGGAGGSGEAGSLVLLGKEPEYAISKGLAIAGQTRVRVRGFLDEVDVYIRYQLRVLISRNVDPLARKLGEEVFEGMVEKQILPAVRDWRHGRLRLLSDIATTAAASRKEYLEGDEGRKRIRRIIDDWSEQILDAINNDTGEIAEKYHFPRENLRISRLDPPQTTPKANAKVNSALDPLDLIASIVALVLSVATVGGGVAAGAAATAGGAAAAAGGAAAATNPVGWIVGIIVVVVVAVIGIWVGRDKIMEVTERSDIPSPLRKIGREKKLLRKIEEKAKSGDIEGNGARNFAEEFKTQHGERITDAFSDSIGAQLRDLARRAAVLIERNSPDG